MDKVAGNGGADGDCKRKNNWLTLERVPGAVQNKPLLVQTDGHNYHIKVG